MKTAAELIAISKSQRHEVALAQAARAASQASAHGRAVAYYYEKMCKVMTEEAPRRAAEGGGWVAVFITDGDYREPGSADPRQDRSRSLEIPGLEDAWVKIQAELGEGYRFARKVANVHTSHYDNPILTRTSFVVEWAAPWVTQDSW